MRHGFSYLLFLDIMQKKIDDLEKLSVNQSKEITELKSILNDCLSRIATLEGGSKTTKDKSSTPNSLRLTSPKGLFISNFGENNSCFSNKRSAITKILDKSKNASESSEIIGNSYSQKHKRFS